MFCVEGSVEGVKVISLIREMTFKPSTAPSTEKMYYHLILNLSGERNVGKYSRNST